MKDFRIYHYNEYQILNKKHTEIQKEKDKQENR